MFKLRINGRSHQIDVPSDMPVLWVLRDVDRIHHRRIEGEREHLLDGWKPCPQVAHQKPENTRREKYQ
jgi:hypothetical protein